jgi:NhaP-type Na+/H+ or K+/H+ antiporter
MDLVSWSAVVGLLLIVMALSDSVLARLPLSTSMLYLLAGVAFSPLWLDWAALSPLRHTQALEWLAEVVVVVSLFGSGLKMSTGLGDGRWLPPLNLAVVSMLVTVALIAGVGWLALGLPLGAAVLLGGILAPTDPVLASDVQMGEPGDRDRLRFALTGEAGLNDGTAFPIIMLGLGLLGLHEIGDFGWRWLAVDVVWAVSGGVAIGAGLGVAVGRFVLYLRRTHKEAYGLDNFLALGLICLSYGAACLAHTYGFLAVFAAGVALRQVEQRASAARTARGAAGGAGAAKASAPVQLTDAEAATDAKQAPAYLANAVLSFNHQIERIGEVVAVIAIGMLLWAIDWTQASWGFVAILLLVIRPLSAWLGLLGSKTSTTQRALIGWFGIRGIGSLYYLTYAANHGLSPALAETLFALVLSVVVVSIFVHGISVTPLMALYEKRKGSRGGATGKRQRAAPEDR